MKKTFSFKNRYGLNIVLDVYPAKNQKGLVFIQHGYTGFKGEDMLLAIKDIFRKKNITSIIFDCTHSIEPNQSDGELKDCTLTSHLEDLEDVVEWAKSTEYYQEPFTLVGHSFGGLSTLIFTEKYNNKVDLLAPICPVVSGKTHQETKIKKDAKAFNRLKLSGFEERINFRTGKPVIASYNTLVDALNYDGLAAIKNINCPTLIIGATEDVSCPPKTVRELARKATHDSFYKEINAPHSMFTKETLQALKEAMLEGLSQLNYK